MNGVEDIAAAGRQSLGQIAPAAAPDGRLLGIDRDLDAVGVADPAGAIDERPARDLGLSLVERAQDEAERIIARAQEQAAFLIEERELTRAAEQRSEEIIEEARGEAVEIQQGADAYAANVLVKLEGEVVKALQSIRRGLSALDERYPPDGSEPTEADPESAPDERTPRPLASAA